MCAWPSAEGRQLLEWGKHPSFSSRCAEQVGWLGREGSALAFCKKRRDGRTDGQRLLLRSRPAPPVV
ncbi:putative Endothelin converting enzyme 1 protein, partial [Naja naja]